MFSISLVAVPLSVMSQSRVRAGIIPSQRWTRAVLVCIVRTSVLVDDGGGRAWLSSVESTVLHGFGMIGKHSLPLSMLTPSLIAISHLDLYPTLCKPRFISLITIMLPRFHLLCSSDARSANREGPQL